MDRNIVSIPATIAEMSASADDFKVDVPFADGVNIEKLTKGDKNPVFVTVEVANETVSRNKRRYTKDNLVEIARQINENKPNAYSGHIEASKRDTANPEVVTMWLGATVVTKGGKSHLYAKGYVLPTADKLKTYLEKALAAGKRIGVSIYGTAKQTWNETAKCYDISNFFLESIDWARHLAEGMVGNGVIAITSEMEGDLVGREDILKTVTVSEMKAVNPDFVKEVENEELIEARATIAEMVLDNEINEKVSNVPARKIIKKLVLAEMTEKTPEAVVVAVGGVLESEEGKAVLKEMTSSTFAPVIDNRASDNSRQFIKGI